MSSSPRVWTKSKHIISMGSNPRVWTKSKHRISMGSSPRVWTKSKHRISVQTSVGGSRIRRGSKLSRAGLSSKTNLFSMPTCAQPGLSLDPPPVARGPNLDEGPELER